MFTGHHHTEETKKKISLSMSGNRNPNFGKRWSEEIKAKMGIVNYKGSKATKQTGRARAEKLYSCPKGKERHHIDGNPLNNAPENIVLVTRKQHLKIDGRLFTATHPSEATKEKLRLAKTGSNNPMFGKSSPCGFRGKHHSEETKTRISAKLKVLRSAKDSSWS